jgi:hypothetical protein
VKTRINVDLCARFTSIFQKTGGCRNSDLTFGAPGNRVRTVKFPESGHMLLYDNGGDAAKALILDVLLNRYAF